MALIPTLLLALSFSNGCTAEPPVPTPTLAAVTRPFSATSSVALRDSRIYLSSLNVDLSDSSVTLLDTSVPTTTTTTTRAPASASTSLAARNPTLTRRSALPQCLKTVELSCLNLAANCISLTTSDTINDLWSRRPCVAAATCYGASINTPVLR
ncbi:hypothetical protein B0H19DRAFT_1263475 [Mycena capillaripes]|nr:hypothetical protein B0H19DRAFT_1263475 [Mycena capillaripes]